MTFEIGQRVRVLPGARSIHDLSNDDYYPDVAGDKIVLIDDGPRDGNYGVEDDEGNYWEFAPEFLESLEVKVGDKVRVSYEGTVTSVRESNRVFVLDGTEHVESNRYGIEVLERAPKVGDFVDPQGEYAPGTVAVLDTDSSSVVVKIEEERWAGSVIGNGLIGDLLPDRWKIIYIPKEAK